MRLPWTRPKADQLELLDADPDVQIDVGAPESRRALQQTGSARSTRRAPPATTNGEGVALLVPFARLYEDLANPRTEFPQAEIDELADDIRQHGILQPIVVHPADAQGRYRIHFGAKRWRAAQRAGLTEVPVVLREAPADPYAQVAENQKRHGLTPLDLARFIKGRVDAGDSNSTIARRLGMDLTSVAHHLALLDLPTALDAAMHAGRCTSPRTLHELSKLHRVEPERVQALLAGVGEITRDAVAAARAESSLTATPDRQGKRQHTSPLAAATTACDRLEAALDRAAKADPRLAESDLASLKQRVAELARRLP